MVYRCKNASSIHFQFIRKGESSMRITHHHWMWIVYIAIGLLLFEVLFLDEDTLYFLIISLLFLYVGKKYYHKWIGKGLFWIGVFNASIAMLHSLAVRWVLFAFLFYLVLLYVKQKRHDSVFVIKEGRQLKRNTETVLIRKPFFQNKFIGRQRTQRDAYEWEDVNIQGFVGDLVVDVSQSVFHDEQAVIFVRHGLGNVQILVPYEIGVSVHVSILAGTVEIFDEIEERVLNESIMFRTKDYDTASQKVKIMTSMFAGHLEVKRI